MTGRAEGHLGREQGPAHVGGEHRDDETDADQHLAPGARHLGHQPRHGGVGQGRELGATQYPERQHRDEHIEQQRQHHTQHGGRAHVPLVSRPGREHRRPLDAGEDPEGDQHGVAHLLGDRHRQGAALLIRREGDRIEPVAGEQDEQQQRQALGQGRHQVEQGRLLHAAGHQQVHRPEDAGLADEGGQGVALAKPDIVRGIDETAQRREGDHQIAHHAYGGAEPIAPGGEEAHQIAKAGAGIAVDAAIETRS
ncbi:hypothetical protein D3C71_1210820 [compost metagenome]